MLSRQRRKQLQRSFPLLLLLIVTAFSFPTLSQETPEPTPAATPTVEVTPIPATEVPPTEEVLPTDVPPTDVPTDVVPTQEPATEEPSPTQIIDPTKVVPTNSGARPTATVVLTSTPEAPVTQPTTEPTVEPTVEATVTSELPERPDNRENPQDLENYCRMNVTNNGDTNPYTFLFTATGSGVASYAWNFGDATNSAAQNPPVKTYAATGTYNITLVCTLTAGGTLSLAGVVNVAAAVSASFYFPNGNEYTGVPPFASVAATNTSSGVGLTYAWRVSGSSDPLAAGLYNYTTTNISPTLTSADFTAAGFNANGPAVIWYHLTVTDPASGLSATASRSVSFTPPAPLYTFDLAPSEIAVGQTVTFTESDLGGGPLDANPATALIWSFVGGTPNSATGPGPHVITYGTAGVFSGILNYAGPGGGGSVEKSVNVFAPLDPVDAGLAFYSSTTIGSNIEVCFENTSTGPIVQSTWNFSPAPSSPAVVPFVNNDPVVCVTYPGAVSIVVELEVVDQEYIDNGGVIGQSSTATLNQTLTLAPIANFSFAPVNPVTQGSNVNFTDQSDTTGGGPVTTWAWTIDGAPFPTQANAENPTGIPFNTIGDHTIRLTVTGPGGTSFVEQIVVVSRAEIGCSITGNPGSGVVQPTNGSETYTAAITSALGRTITYAWSLTDSAGVIQTGTASTIAVNWPAQGYGTFILKVIATTPDGSICEATRTFTRAWLQLDCQINTPTPSPLYPTGGTYNFTATVNNLGGRAVTNYDWYLNGSLVQSGASATYTYTTPNDSTLVGTLAQSVRYVVTVNNNTAPTTGYVPATSTCEATRNFNVTAWPDLVCNAASMSGNFSPIPLNDVTGVQETHSYTVAPAGIAGRTVTYVWTVTNGTIVSGQGTATVVVQWDPTVAIENGGIQNGDISVTATVTNPDGVSNANDTCTSTHTVGGGNGAMIRYESLVCNMPTGDQAVVIGEFADHNFTLTHIYGRPVTPGSLLWTLEREDLPNGSNTWSTVATGTNPNFTEFQFTAPDNVERNFRLSYVISLDAANGIGGDSCISPYLLLSTYGVGEAFQCESPAPLLIGNGSPLNPAITYIYNTDIDNSTGLNLSYIWSIIDRHGTETTLYTYSSTTNGNVYSTNNGTAGGTQLTLAQLGPIGPGSYTLRLRVTDPSGTATNNCDLQRPLLVGFVDAAYTYTIATPGTWTNTALPVNREICLTNTSTYAPVAPAAPSPDAIVYAWTLGGTAGQNSLGQLTFSTDSIPCFSFNTPGSYPITVQITNAEGNMTDTYSLTFNVYGLQGIAINRSPIDDFSSTQSFTSTGTNITNMALNDWVFDRLTPTSNPGFATRNNQQNPTNVGGFTPGTYRATVTGTGPLGNTSASLEFEILAANELRARFTPSQWAGIAPMTVCFTDRSTSGTPILTWEWDLDGDTVYETTGQNPGCFTYPNPGMTVQVRLRVTNANFTRTATNTVRTYSNLEASQNFRIIPQGGMAFCFQSELVNSTLTSWDFSFNPTPGVNMNTVPNDPACFTYSSAGTYLVQMCFISAVGNTPGCIERPVTVTGGGDPVPSINGSASCSAAGVATFTLTNTGGAMTIADQVRITNSAGSVIVLSPLQLGAGQSVNYTATGEYGLLTLRTTDVVLTTTTTCFQPPTLTISHVCLANGSTTFTVSNSSPDTAANQPYEVRDASNLVVASGTLNIPANGGSQSVTVADFGPLTFTSSSATHGPSATVSDTSDCAQPPILSVVSQCLANGTATFTVANNSPDTAANQPYTVTNAASTIVASGTLTAGANGGTQVITVTTQYTLLTFSTDNSASQGTTTIATDTEDCNEPPTLSAVATCAADGTATFTVTNISTETAANQPYTVTNAASTVVDSGTLTAAANGGTQVITITSEYTQLTLSSTGPQGVTTVINTSTDCDEPPVLSVVTACLVDGSATFTVTNNSTELAANQAYTITNAASTVVASGTLTVAPNGGTQVITVDDDYTALTFTSNGGAQGPTTVISANTDCVHPPVLSAFADCAQDGTGTFTITNDSTESASNQAYTVTDELSNVVDSGTLTVAANGGTQTIIITGDYSLLTLTSTGTEGPSTVINITTNCDEPPVLSVVAECLVDGTAVFTITNSSLETDANQPYEVRNAANDVVASGTLNIPMNGGTQVITVVNEYTALTLTSDGGPQGPTTVINETTDCDQPPVLSAMADCTADGTATFVITNDSTESASNQSYVVTDGKGLEVATGTLNVPANGGTQTVNVPGVFGTITLTSTGPEGETTELDVNTICVNPVVEVVGVCEAGNMASFLVTNYGPDMTQPSVYNIVSGLNQTVLASGTFQLNNTESVAISVPAGLDLTDGVTFVSDEFGASVTVACADDVQITPPNVNNGGNNGIVAPSCGRGCPVFKMYHTDEVGGWEIFRLDSADQETQTSIRENLSLGLDEDVSNMAPSLSPDNNWIVFSSNRDGNWEIYVAPTSGGNADNVERVTFNSVAIDSDPVWGPNNFVVFETTRHGNWDLYALDMETGTEFRLTDSGGNDINPYWSPDGSKLVFQSDRPDENGARKWQVYELTLRTLALSKLSDGSAIDVDPEYSNRGNKVAFRSYESEGAMSQLSLMNTDGSSRMVFSDPAGDATNAAWSPNDTYIAYQSDLDGDLDIYVYEVATGETRHLTDNTIADYAPTWLCDDIRVVWTSDIVGDPNIFEVNVTPISDDPLDVEEFADQMTFEVSNDIYPLSSPAEENASREGETVRGSFGVQTVFLEPNVSLTPIDLSNEGITRPMWTPVNACSPS